MLDAGACPSDTGAGRGARVAGVEYMAPSADTRLSCSLSCELTCVCVADAGLDVMDAAEDTEAAVPLVVGVL